MTEHYLVRNSGIREAHGAFEHTGHQGGHIFQHVDLGMQRQREMT